MTFYYTTDMARIDQRWRDGEEDPILMAEYHQKIIQHAQTLGFKGATLTYQRPPFGETVTRLFSSDNDRRDYEQKITDKTVATCVTCETLIQTLSNLMAERYHPPVQRTTPVDDLKQAIHRILFDTLTDSEKLARINELIQEEE